MSSYPTMSAVEHFNRMMEIKNILESVPDLIDYDKEDRLLLIGLVEAFRQRIDGPITEGSMREAAKTINPATVKAELDAAMHAHPFNQS